MTQRISDQELDDLCFNRRSMHHGPLAADLLSLRAAVRRVLEADAAYVSTEGRLAALRFNREMCALRAEMAGIDKEGGA